MKSALWVGSKWLLCITKTSYCLIILSKLDTFKAFWPGSLTITRCVVKFLFFFTLTETNLYQVLREIHNIKVSITMIKIMSKQISLWTTFIRWTCFPVVIVSIRLHPPKSWIFIPELFIIRLKSIRVEKTRKQHKHACGTPRDLPRNT